MIVTALSAAAATEAAAQPFTLGGSGGFGRAAQAAPAPAQNRAMPIENRQVQSGPVTSSQHLAVVHSTGQIAAGANAQGNTLFGAVENDALDLTSEQTSSGDIAATTDLTLTGEAQGPVNLASHAGANRLEAAGYDADLTLDASQASSGDVAATTTVEAVDGRMLQGAYVASSALGNAAVLGGDHARIEGSVDQDRSGRTTAHVQSDTRYLPARADYSAQAVGNAASSAVTYGSQVLDVTQRTSGAGTYASVAVSSGNAWDLAGRARAVANQTILSNQGGSVVATTDQANSAYLRAATRVNAYDFGAAQAYASGAGNVVEVGNNDVYLEIDNTQLNSGGVEVQSTFTGHNGYDAVVGADAVGNSVTGYACSTCEGYIDAANDQTNSGHVSATANAQISGTARSVIGAANATGNSATFYVSRPSGGH